jgi:ceramide glucosyltransferase
MSSIADSVALLSAFTLSIHLVGMALAAWRSRPARQAAVPASTPGVTFVRPLCGLDHDARHVLAASFALDYPAYEILFCVERADDPVLPLVRELIATYPRVDARILIGTDHLGDNPKLNNMAKGWRAARHDWVCFTDSNLIVPPDYIQRLLASWRPDTGCVSAPPVGGNADGIWAELECAFLNSYQARWQFAVDTLGFGFAQGKTLFFRRDDLASVGGIAALACEPAEDAAATKVVRAMGKRVRLVDPPFTQPLGRRDFRQVWKRQMRWARLRRATFPLLYLPELLTGSLVPLLTSGLAAYLQEVAVLPSLAVYAAIWYGAELALTLFARWQFTWRTPFAWLMRDLLLPVLWIAGLAGRSFTWREQPADAAATVWDAR